LIIECFLKNKNNSDLIKNLGFFEKIIII